MVRIEKIESDRWNVLHFDGAKLLEAAGPFPTKERAQREAKRMRAEVARTRHSAPIGEE